MKIWNYLQQYHLLYSKEAAQQVWTEWVQIWWWLWYGEHQEFHSIWNVISVTQLNFWSFIVSSTGLAGVRTQGNQFQFAKQPLVIVYYNVDYVKDPKGSNYWRNRVLKVAQEYKDIASFAVSNKEEFSQVLYTFRHFYGILFTKIKS